MYVALGNIRKGNYVGDVGFILNALMTDVVLPVVVVMLCGGQLCVCCCE